MLTRSNEKNWYVLVTANRAERKVGARLSNFELENFVPIHLKLRQWHDRKKWVEVPLFNNYIFVFTDEKRRQEVFKVTGIMKYLSIAGNLCKVRASEIERIKLLCSYTGKVHIEEGSLKKGDEVEILEGHFIGFRGHLIKEANSTKLKISIASLNCFAVVEVEKANVRKAMVC